MDQVRADLGDDIPPMNGPTLSVYGSTHLRSAIMAARASRTDAPGYAQDAWAHIEAARAVATQMGRDRNDYGLAFGPSNVAQHEVAVAVELEDGAEAVRRAHGVRLGPAGAVSAARAPLHRPSPRVRHGRRLRGRAAMPPAGTPDRAAADTASPDGQGDRVRDRVCPAGPRPTERLCGLARHRRLTGDVTWEKGHLWCRKLMPPADIHESRLRRGHAAGHGSGPSRRRHLTAGEAERTGSGRAVRPVRVVEVLVLAH